MALPELRNVQVVPFEQDGQTLLRVADSEGIVPAQIVLSPAAFFAATCLDGIADVADVQAQFAQQTDGAILTSENLLELVATLDEHGFLLTERYFAIRRTAEDAYRQAPTRVSYGAGAAYPDDPEALRTLLDGFFVDERGPGQPLGSGGEGLPARGLIVPHIDFARGGPAYAHGYGQLFKCGKPKTVFVFGVAHVGASTPFVLTRKDFETPFGVLPTNRDLVERIADAVSWDPFVDELAHRGEHSIEFQAVLLARLYGTDVPIVPILCAQLSDDPTSSASPAADDDVRGFLAACHAVAADPAEAITVIAGADLAHVGRQFGDDLDITDDVIARVAQRDKEDLAHVTAVDPEAFHRSVMKDANERKMCGLGCIYATLKTLEGLAATGQTLCYDYASTPDEGMVSFASILLT